MNFTSLFRRDLRFYRRTNLTLVGLAALCCAILTGGLLVGDSVRYSLGRLGQMRLGQTQLAMSMGDRYFRQEIAEQLSSQINAPVTAVLMQKGILESSDSEIRINEINIYGVQDDFWTFGQITDTGIPIAQNDELLLSQAVKQRLGEKQKEWLLRFEKEQPLSTDLIFTRDEPVSRAWPTNIAGDIPDEMLGRFGLIALQQAPLNVFVPIAWLAEKADVPGKANMLLIGPPREKQHDIENINQVLRGLLSTEDLQIRLRAIESAQMIELSSPRIFLDPSIGENAVKAGTQGYKVFTYFVNEIRCGEKMVPYSMVSAVGMEGGVAAGLEENEIVLNEWLAQELNADAGQKVTLTYYKPVSATQLLQESQVFTVKGVAPMMGVFSDETLMPEFPGLADAENCRDWNSGVPIDLSKIGDRDEAYWDKYKGTPKALISMATAQRIWSNRFGNLTAVRWPAAANSVDSIKSEVLQKINPAALGFELKDVQSAVKRQAKGSSDFASLFAGLSMFLIFSAAVLLALVFKFYIETRLGQAGLLMALGWDHPRVTLFFMAEGTVLAAAGCLAGVLFAIVYTKFFIAVLNSTFWTNAVASLHLVSHASVFTLIRGVIISLLICVLAMLLGLFGRLRKPVHQLLTGTVESAWPRSARRKGLFPAAAILIGSGLCWPILAGSSSQTAAFFVSGVLLLAGMFLLAAAILKWMCLPSRSFARSQLRLAIKNIPRRIGRSMAVLMTAACGVFLVISVGTNHKDIGATAKERQSGTGGFSLIVETTLPMTEKPSLEADSGSQMPAVERGASVAFKVYQQEDASCLNLNRVQRPTLLGVDPQELAQRGAFKFQSAAERGKLEGWQLLTIQPGENMIPVIGDYATVYWALGKNTGDTLEYESETGRVVLKIVGVLTDSLLQGKLFVSQEAFEKMFPSVEGYQLFLIDADWANRELLARQLSRGYRDFGMEAVTADSKLATFHEVENTYLAIFLVLGGLGLVLGSAGVGLVLLLNVLDRRGELAMMQAVGFRPHDLRFILFAEHGVLLAAGIVCGLIPALVAVLPSLWTQGRGFPLGPIALLTAAILASGAVWIRLAVRGILRMNFLDVLKNE